MAMIDYDDKLREILERYLQTYHSANDEIAATQAIAGIKVLWEPVGFAREDQVRDFKARLRASLPIRVSCDELNYFTVPLYAQAAKDGET